MANDIGVDYDLLAQQIFELTDEMENILNLPELRVNRDCTNYGMLYLDHIYSQFSNIVAGYNGLFHITFNHFIDIAIGIMEQDHQDPFDFPGFNELSDEFSYESEIAYRQSFYSNWYLNIQSLYYMSANIIENLAVFCSNLVSFALRVVDFSEHAAIYGNAANLAKRNFRWIHLSLINNFLGAAQIIITRISLYRDSYYDNSLLASEGSNYIYSREDMMSCIIQLQDSLYGLNASHNSFINETEQLKIDTSNLYDYTGITPLLMPLTEGFNSIEDRLSSLINAVDQNESDFLSHKTVIENSLNLLIAHLENCRTNITSVDIYLCDIWASTSPLEIAAYNAQVNAIRSENEAENLDAIIDGVNNSVEVNRVCAAENLELQESLRAQKEALKVLFTVVSSIIAAMATCGMSALVEALVFALGASDAVFHAYDSYEHYLNSVDISNGNLDPSGNNPLRNAIGDNAYETSEEILDDGCRYLLRYPVADSNIKQIVYVGKKLTVFLSDGFIELTGVELDPVANRVGNRARTVLLNLAGNEITGTENTFHSVSGISNGGGGVTEVTDGISSVVIQTEINSIDYTEPILNEDYYSQEDLENMGVLGGIEALL